MFGARDQEFSTSLFHSQIYIDDSQQRPCEFIRATLCRSSEKEPLSLLIVCQGLENHFLMMLVRFRISCLEPPYSSGFRNGKSQTVTQLHVVPSSDVFGRLVIWKTIRNKRDVLESQEGVSSTEPDDWFEHGVNLPPSPSIRSCRSRR